MEATAAEAAFNNSVRRGSSLMSRTPDMGKPTSASVVKRPSGQGFQPETGSNEAGTEPTPKANITPDPSSSSYREPLIQGDTSQEGDKRQPKERPSYASDKILSARASDLGAQSAMSAQSSWDISSTSFGKSGALGNSGSATDRAPGFLSASLTNNDTTGQASKRQPRHRWNRRERHHWRSKASGRRRVGGRGASQACMPHYQSA